LTRESQPLLQKEHEMEYAEANKALRKVGAAHATGDTLAACHADVVMSRSRYCPGVAGRLYRHLAGLDTDIDRHEECKRLCTDPWRIFEIGVI